jgi:chromosome segregation ATPase
MSTSNLNRNQNSAQGSGSASGSNTTNQAAPNMQQIQLALRIREQEVSALKAQNKHLIERIQEHEGTKHGIEENNQLISSFRGQLDQQLTAALNGLQEQVQRFTKAVLVNTESALKGGFEAIQGTLKAIYTQSQRGQEQISQSLKIVQEIDKRIEGHSIDVLTQAKVQNLQFQDKLTANIQNFLDRVERTIDSRLEALSGLDSLRGKQEETLKSLESVDRGRADMISKLMSLEITQKNTDSVNRETQTQIQILRAEIRALRTEIQNVTESGTPNHQRADLEYTEALAAISNAKTGLAEARREKSEAENYLRRINEQLNHSKNMTEVARSIRDEDVNVEKTTVMQPPPMNKQIIKE